MDGFTLIEKLRQREETKNLPIIVLSAAHLTAEKELYLKQRIQQFFGKGTSELNTILNEIQRLLVRPV
jgi:CheY-like chemotaxis protein